MAIALDYQDGDVTCKGQLFMPHEQDDGKKPAVLVFHDWSGCTGIALEYAEEISQLGYVALAADLYGEGRTGESVEEKSALMMAIKDDRSALLKRMQAALAALRQLPSVDSNRIVAIGFCFGGLCALDLARSGEKLCGVVSFHGLLDSDDAVKAERIVARVLALHGDRDPMVPPEQVLTFQQEMTAAGADWQFITYGNTYHAFMNPDANDPDFGTVYNAQSAARAWDAMQLFLLECFDTAADEESESCCH